MEKLLEFARNGVDIEEPGIIPANKHGVLKSKVTIADRHYINILSMSPLEVGYLERLNSGRKVMAKTTSKAQEFLNLSNSEKLDTLIRTVASLCAKMIVNTFPDLKEDFSEQRVMNMLEKPRDVGQIYRPFFEKLGIDVEQMAKEIMNPTLEENRFLNNSDMLPMEEFYNFNVLMDMYFYTPFGFYLQLIQPLYIEPFFMEDEAEKLIAFKDDIGSARIQLFSPVACYDLTALGETVLIKGKKPGRVQKLPKDVTDEVMFQSIEFHRSGEDFWDEEIEDEDLAKIIDLSEILKTKNAGKGGAGPKSNDAAKNQKKDKVFVFNVYPVGSKRKKKQIKLMGNQTLDELQIDSLKLQQNQKFMYIYDYGDEHRFEIEVSEIS